MKKAMFLLASMIFLFNSCSKTDVPEGKICDPGYFGQVCDSASIKFFKWQAVAYRYLPDTDMYVINCNHEFFTDTLSFAFKNLMDTGDTIYCKIDSSDRYHYHIYNQQVNGKTVEGSGHVYNGYYTADFYADTTHYFIKAYP